MSSKLEAHLFVFCALRQAKAVVKKRPAASLASPSPSDVGGDDGAGDKKSKKSKGKKKVTKTKGMKQKSSGSSSKVAKKELGFVSGTH